MSVQLILYPQNYSGEFNVISIIENEFVVNGINFNNLNSSSSHSTSASNTILDTLTNAPPTIVNTWYRFRSTSSGTPALPTNSAGNVVFNSVVGIVLTGIYQRLSNLIVGQNYTITINIPFAGTGSLLIGAFNGTTQITNQLFSGSTYFYNPNSTITHNFTATSATNTLVVSYFNSGVENFQVSNISVTPTSTTPSGTNTILQSGQVICDLYEDEDIPLTLSVDDFKNAAEKVQSYSKAFKLPATKRNNQIFDNIFEVTRADDGIIFNPYVKTKCELKQDGFILFEGYLRLIDIQDKEGEISYNVNLYSEVVALADYLKDRDFHKLDFTELTHEYNKIQIKASWNDAPDSGITYTNPSTSGFRNANDTVKYPFVDWNHQFIVADNPTGGAGPVDGFPQLPNLEAVFRPFIQVKYLIDRIFEDPTPFTYTSSFFDSDDFAKLYMDFNWGADSSPVFSAQTNLVGNGFTGGGTFSYGSIYGGSPPVVSNYATSSYSVMQLNTTTTAGYNFLGWLPPNYSPTTYILTSTVVNETYNIDYVYSIENTDTVSREIECQWLYNSIPIDYSGVQTIPANGGTYSYQGDFTQVMSTIGDTLQVQFRTNAGTASKVRQTETAFDNQLTGCSFIGGISSITTSMLLQTLRGETGQWDFLKGIMTMFNLVSIPDKSNPNNILIEPYEDIFISNTNCSTTGEVTLACRSIAHDWTDKIDISQIKLKPLTDLTKKTIFKFVEDDDDYVFNVYKNAVHGHLYGSKVFDASGFTVLDGEDEIIAEPFAATIPKPLMTQFPQLVTPAIYSYNADDDTSEGFDNAPRIMYNKGIKDSGITYYIPEQNGVTSENQSDYLQFGHIKLGATAADDVDFHFGECQLVAGQTSTLNNLFNTYWLPYFNELYNADTRTMTLKVNLNSGDIATFNMYDTVFIKNREFRVNKIDYKPNDLATVEFILIP
tara:strand:- start:3076 stop:5907 length:2832 start_codon:yes stop_codon:yes gene_type:complete